MQADLFSPPDDLLQRRRVGGLAYRATRKFSVTELCMTTISVTQALVKNGISQV